MGFDYLPVGVALFSAHDFKMLKANRVFVHMLDQIVDPQWRGEKAIGQTLFTIGALPHATLWSTIFQRIRETKKTQYEDKVLLNSLPGQAVYWNWILEAIEGQQGDVDYLLLTARDVTAQVVAEQQHERLQIKLNQEKRAAERDRHWLRVVEAIASNIRGSLDASQIGRNALQALVTHFHPRELYLYTTDPVFGTFRLLNAHVPAEQSIRRKERGSATYDEASSFAYALSTRQPIIIEDIHRQDRNGIALPVLLKESSLQYEQELLGYHSYICVPLWLGEQCIGVLTAFFGESFQKQGPEVRSFITCCRYIEAGLANARLHIEAIQERVQLRSVLDQLPEGVLFVEGTEGTLSYTNPAAAELLGFSLEDLLNKPIHTFTYVDQEATTLQTYNEVLFPWTFAVVRSLAGETIRSQQMFVSLPHLIDDDAQRHKGFVGQADTRKLVPTSIVLVSSAPIYDEHHIITGAVVIFQDITAQKSLEQQKEDFLWMVNHELRTPITIIQGFAELLADDGGSSEEARQMQRDALHNILDQSNTLADLIDDVFDLSTIEHRTFTLQRAHNDLVATIAHAVKDQDMVSKRHHISFVFKTDAAVTSVLGFVDEKRLIQALRNLINNAIKYSPAGGAIEVGLEYVKAHPQQVVLWVKDEGIGIAANDVGRIFERFQRGSTFDAAISGLGVGLFVVKEIVQQHGGTVQVESRLGQGTTFSIVLPLQQ